MRSRIEGGHRAGEYGRATRQRAEHHDDETREHEPHDHTRCQCRLRNPEVIDDRKHDNRCNRQRLRMGRRHVVGERQRHRGTARDLADDETPTRQCPKERRQALATVDVRSTRLRIQRGERRRRRGIAIGDGCGHEQAQQQVSTGRCARRRERREDACADHRAETDDDGVERPEPARKTRRRWSIVPRCASRRHRRSII